LVATATIPRGGKLIIDPVGEGERMGFRLTAEGTNAKVPPAIPDLLAGAAEGLDAHGIQPYYTGLLARTSGLKISLASKGESVVLTAGEA
jgi:histidine phosphotransferase ChpT